ncbi:flagellar protein FlgN, partial [Bordetella pertussis]|uniref:flagellar protein FlgN n=1 Tax=Bordetella pertussis TaxID=520 RepID=UPI0021CC1609
MNSAALKSCLERENALVVEFLHALEAETEALMDRRAHESLQAAVQRKETLADDLAQLGAERDALLSGAGLASGPAGTDAAAAAHPLIRPGRPSAGHLQQGKQLHQGRGRQPRG